MKENPGAPSDLARGVDITDTHGAFDWKAAANAGVKFGYITAALKAAPSSTQLDANWRAMKEAGILRGVCHYLRPTRDVEAQAKSFCELLGNLGAELPPAVRVKTVPTHTGLNEWDAVRVEKRVELLLQWVRLVEAASGRKCILSTNALFVQRYLQGAAGLAEYDLWLADYRTATPPPPPAPWTRWTFWRYSETGHFPGLSGHVCLTYFNGTRAELDRYAAPSAAVEAKAAAPEAEAPPEPVEAEPAEAEPLPDEDKAAAAEPDVAEPSRSRQRRGQKRDGA